MATSSKPRWPQVPHRGDFTSKCPYCKGNYRQLGKNTCGFCEDGRVPRSWVREDFDEWSELTKERDGYRADAEAERHRPY